MIARRRHWFRPAPALALPPRPVEARTGWLEGVHDGWLRGWAHDPARPGAPARIALSASGLAHDLVVIADHYRADVQAAGHGQGICGFALPLPGLLPERIEARWADTDEPLPGSPWQARAQPLPLEGWRGTRMAVLEPPLPGSATLTGYALDTAAPAVRLPVTLVAGAARFGPVLACRHAAAAARMAGGDSFHGFHVAWDPAACADGAEPELRDARDDAVLLRVNRTWARSVGLA